MEFRHNANRIMMPDQKQHHALTRIREQFDEKVSNILELGWWSKEHGEERKNFGAEALHLKNLGRETRVLAMLFVHCAVRWQVRNKKEII